jgi:peptidylprolyl isomerase
LGVPDPSSSKGLRVHTRSQLPVLSAALVAAAVTLAGCGSSNSSSADSATSPSSPSSSSTSAATGASGTLDNVTFAGNVGSGATITFTKKFSQASDATKVVRKGKGDKVAKGDSLIIQTVIADATTGKTVASSYQDQQPQVVTLSKQVQKVFLDALENRTVGSRVAVLAPSSEIFGSSGNAQLGIGASDAVVIVFDLIGKPLDKPTGQQHAAPAWFPSLTKTKGVISGFDFKGTPKPDGALKVANLRDGTGAVVKKGQTIFARYLGEVYQGAKPFDQNFDQDAPASFQIGVGHVIPGWDKSLVGEHVGSEVVLAIPPKEGYGKQGNSQAGIKGTDTLYFVVDIVGAA